MKSYTDLEQSKKLAEILPLESADMCYRIIAYNPDDTHVYQPYCFVGTLESDIPCWSFAALFDVLPDGTDITKDKSDTENERYMCTVGVKNDIISTFADNPVDTCFGMILKLHEIRMKKVKESQETNTVHGNGDNREKINSYPQRYMRDSWYND